MNRAEYMKELAYLLQDMPDSEKEEALQYYEDYFEDAGAENEEQVVAELGRPERLAAIIREGVGNGYENQDAEYTEHGFENERYKIPGYQMAPPDQVERKRLGEGGNEAGNGEAAYKRADSKTSQTSGSYSSKGPAMGQSGAYTGAGTAQTGGTYDSRGNRWGESTYTDRESAEAYGAEDAEYRSAGNGRKRPERRRNPFVGLLLIIGLIFLLPVLFGGLCVLGGGALAVVCAVGGVALAVIIITVVFLVVGVILIGVGIGKVFLFPLAGIMIIGAGLLLLALGMLALWLSVLVCGKAVPAMIHGIGSFFGFIGKKLRRGGEPA